LLLWREKDETTKTHLIQYKSAEEHLHRVVKISTYLRSKGFRSFIQRGPTEWQK